jgi:hypothetical protein
VILAENDRSQDKKCIKTPNFKRLKIDIKHLQDIKNMLKSIFNGSGRTPDCGCDSAAAAAAAARNLRGPVTKPV